MIIDYRLRPSQIQLRKAIDTEFKDHRRLLAIASTGIGKTVLSAHLIADLMSVYYPEIASGLVSNQWSIPNPLQICAPKQIVFICHRDALVKQTIAKLKAVFASRVKYEGKINERRMSEAITVIKSGKKYNFMAPIVVVSQQSLNPKKLRKYIADKHFNPAVLIFDEAHTTSTCPTGKDMMEFLSDKIDYMLGLTATPFWSDKEMVANQFFDQAVVSRSFSELVDSGELVGYHYLEPDYPEQQVEEYKDQYGQIKERSLDCRYETDEQLAYALAKFREVEAIAGVVGGKAIAFARNVEHGKKIAKYFTDHGVKTGIISYEITDKERELVYENYERGDTQMLVSVDALGVGYDFDEILYVLMFMKGKSLVKHWQKLGRGARTCKRIGKKICYIVDYAKTVEYHERTSGMGMPDLVVITPEEVMGLKPRKKRDLPAPTKVCPKCDTINFASARKCSSKDPVTKESNCSHVFPVKDMAKTLQIVPGEMHRIYRSDMKLDDLDRIGYFRSLRAKAWARKENPNTALFDYNASEIGQQLPLPSLNDFIELREYTMGAITGKPTSTPAALELLKKLIKLRKENPKRWTVQVVYSVIFLEFEESVAEYVNDIFVNQKLSAIDSLITSLAS